ncbi:hypothetical protein XENORESO_002161 [Xenotaenia resolanae]|uniref:Uncharacterized protein n=1 Tax=Xenotaenia resolanae TaxID=208358 RepID=A0ABV0X057_9TELE
MASELPQNLLNKTSKGSVDQEPAAVCNKSRTQFRFRPNGPSSDGAQWTQNHVNRTLNGVLKAVWQLQPPPDSSHILAVLSFCLQHAEKNRGPRFCDLVRFKPLFWLISVYMNKPCAGCQGSVE